MMFRPRLLPCLLLLAACAAEVPTAPAEPSLLTVFKAPPTGTPGWLLDDSLSVRLTDQAGRPIANATVTWQTEADGAQVETTTPGARTGPDPQFDPHWVRHSATTTDAEGIARVRYLPGWANGTQRVIATTGTLSTTISVPVTSLVLKSAVIGYEYACGLDQGGKLYCWTPSWENRDVSPRKLPSGMRPVAANTTDRFSVLTGDQDVGFCGLTTQHEVRCWTKAAFDANRVATPVPVTTPVAFTSIVQVRSNRAFDANSTLCGLDAAGQAWCRGNNFDGQLGDGTVVSRTSFAPVSGAMRFSKLTMTDNRACGLDSAGAAWCWGRSERFGLGVALESGSVKVPTQVAVGHQYSDIGFAGDGVCGIAMLTHLMECWGSGLVRREGDPPSGSAGRDPLTPKAVVGRPTLLGIAPGGEHGDQALTTDGRIANFESQGEFEQLILELEFASGLVGFSSFIPSGVGATCAVHQSGSTVCSLSLFRAAAVPVPN